MGSTVYEILRGMMVCEVMTRANCEVHVATRAVDAELGEAKSATVEGTHIAEMVLNASNKVRMGEFND